MIDMELVQVLRKVTDKDLQEELVSYLRDQLPTCYFCQGWEIIKSEGPDKGFVCHNCGAVSEELPHLPNYSVVERSVDEALLALWNLRKHGGREMEELTKDALDIVREWSKKLILPCPACGSSFIEKDLVAKRYICQDCGLKGPVEDEEAQGWNIRREKEQ